jgi:hypothetical protein
LNADRRSARYAVQQMRSNGAQVLTALLSNSDRKIEDYARYTYYHYFTKRRPHDAEPSVR